MAPSERDTSAHDVRIGVERTLPEPVAENGDGRLAGLVLFGKQQASQQRLGAEQVKQSGGGAHSVDPLWLLEARQREAGRLRDGHLFESLVFVLALHLLPER